MILEKILTLFKTQSASGELHAGSVEAWVLGPEWLEL